MVQGLDMVVPLMNIGEVAEVKIDPRFAYGSLGLKNEKEPELNIPPEATVSFCYFFDVFFYLYLKYVYVCRLHMKCI